MEASIKHISILLVFTLSCTSEPDSIPSIDDSLSQKESLLVGTWRYEEIIANSETFLLADPTLEPGQSLVEEGIGGNRAYLFRRKINYSTDKTYQLRWDERGDYNLGTEGDPNWQPNFGYWEIEGDSLFHNRGNYYEAAYHIGLSESEFSRRSYRYMSSAYIGANWMPTETVLFSEYFIRTMD